MSHDQPWCFPGVTPNGMMCPLLLGTVNDRLIFSTAAKSPQSCLTLCNPIDDSPPGSAVPGILQARTLEWVVISFSNA